MALTYRMLPAFLSAVQEMRTLQVKYFKTRDRDVLIESKAAEKRVDAMVKEFMEHVGESGRVEGV